MHLAKTLGTQAGDFYELMTGPTSKILDKWFESDVLKVGQIDFYCPDSIFVSTWIVTESTLAFYFRKIG